MLTFFKFSFFFGGIVSLFLGLFIYLKNKRGIIDISYSGLSLCCAVWSFGFLGMIMAKTEETASFWRWFMESGSILIPAFWLHFVYAFLNIEKSKKTNIFIVYLISVCLWLLNFVDLLGKEVFAKEMVKKYIFDFYPTAGIGYYLFFLFFFSVVFYSLLQLLKSYKKNVGLKAFQIKFLIIGALLGFGGGGMTFLLTLNVDIPPLGIIFFAFYPIIIAYAITKHHLFDIKVIVTELLTFGIWIFVLTRTVLADTLQEVLISGGLLLFLIVSGILLIRSVMQEVKSREKIEKLAKELEGANKKLESANERLKELDQLKTEFVSLATHQIRGPVTAIKGYASMLLEGDFGAVPNEVKKPVETILESSSSLAGIVQDFLDISRIEQGRMKYEFADIDLSKLVQEVARELSPSIEKKGLRLVLEIAPNIIARADAGKMKQVIENLLDNAVKYTNEGSISVSLYSSKPRTVPQGITVRGEAERKAVLAVKDTGIGISKETLPKLFQKFSRAEDASKANMKGTGLGLYVAKQLVEAQHGTIRAESPASTRSFGEVKEGEGKGATFSVELPLKM